MNDNLISLWIIIGFAVILIAWYVLLDNIASKQTHYQLPGNCNRCGEKPGLKNWHLKRVWFFAGIEILEQFFPVSVREVQVPLCETCYIQAEENRRLVHKTSLLFAAILYLPLSFLIFVLYEAEANCSKSSVGSALCIGGVGFFSLVLGFVFAIIGYLVVKEIMEVLPKTSPPARFNIFGKLSFRNASIQKEFLKINPNPESSEMVYKVPYGIFIGISLWMAISFISDIDLFLNGHRADPPILIYPIHYILFLLKIIAAILAYRLKKSVVYLMIAIPLLDVLFNPGFNIENKAEELIIGGALLIILLYKWIQSSSHTVLKA